MRIEVKRWAIAFGSMALVSPAFASTQVYRAATAALQVREESRDLQDLRAGARRVGLRIEIESDGGDDRSRKTGRLIIHEPAAEGAPSGPATVLYLADLEVIRCSKRKSAVFCEALDAGDRAIRYSFFLGKEAEIAGLGIRKAVSLSPSEATLLAGFGINGGALPLTSQEIQGFCYQAGFRKGASSKSQAGLRGGAGAVAEAPRATAAEIALYCREGEEGGAVHFRSGARDGRAQAQGR